jgi:hypothetical protein
MMNILFSYLFFTFVQNFKPQKKDLLWHVYLNVFNHIVIYFLKIHKFFYIMSALAIFGKGRKQYVKRQMSSLYQQSRMNHLT